MRGRTGGRETERKGVGKRRKWVGERRKGVGERRERMGERRKIIAPSLCFETDDDYILDEDVYSTLTISLLQTDTITVTEKIHELFEQEEIVIMSCQKTRRGRILINQDIYKIFMLRMNNTFF
jgi:hypothetical protein